MFKKSLLNFIDLYFIVPVDYIIFFEIPQSISKFVCRYFLLDIFFFYNVVVFCGIVAMCLAFVVMGVGGTLTQVQHPR